MNQAPNPPLPERLAFSVKESALSAGLSEDTIRSEIRSGRLVARKVGRRTIITRKDFSRWLAGLPVLVACVILVACALLAVAASAWQTAASQSVLTSQSRLAQVRVRVGFGNGGISQPVTRLATHSNSRPISRAWDRQKSLAILPGC